MKCNFFRNLIWLNYFLVNNIIKVFMIFNVLLVLVLEVFNLVCSLVNDF